MNMLTLPKQPDIYKQAVGTIHNVHIHRWRLWFTCACRCTPNSDHLSMELSTLKAALITTTTVSRFPPWRFPLCTTSFGQQRQ